jgi:protein TonB
MATPTGVAAATEDVATPYMRATHALADGRMLSPAGDNAVEPYLAAREQGAEQARAQAALAELQPYVLIAAEQAIARADAQEALRLQGLIERIDAQTPALPRLRTAVTLLAREQATRAAATTETPSPSLAVAVAPRPATPSASAPVPAPPPTETAPPASAPSLPVVVQAEAAPVVSAPAPAPRVVQGERVPRLLQDAQPRYPLPALRARIEGQADVAFTIQPDGSVRDVRVLSSTADGMFDASALAVAQRWRFEATGRSHASSRTVRFRLPAADARDG